MAKSRLFKIIALILSLLLIGSSYQLYVDLERINQQDKTIADLKNETSAQKGMLSQLEISISDMKKNL